MAFLAQLVETAEDPFKNISSSFSELGNITAGNFRCFVISQASKYTRSSSKLPFAKGNMCEDLETLEAGYMGSLWKQLPRTLKTTHVNKMSVNKILRKAEEG